MIRYLFQIHDNTAIASSFALVPLSNLPPTSFPLHPTPQPDLLVPDELPYHPRPILMVRQIGVEFIRDLVQRGQSTPRDSREIVMFVMQAHIISQKVQRAIVGECLRDRRQFGRVPSVRGLFLEHVMLRDEMRRARVQRAGQEGTHDQVHQRVRAEPADYGGVEDDLGDDVEDVDAGDGELVDHHWTDGVEEDLEGAEPGFAEDGVEEEGFEGGGEVGVQAIDTEGLVMC